MGQAGVLSLRSLEALRTELVGFAYRMLGSPFEAEDAAQEAIVRAWRNLDRHDPARASLRTWVFRIAANVCVDMLRSPQRRARAMDLGPASPAGAALGAPLPETAWVLPIEDHRAVPADGDPAELALQRESIRLAFIAALQHLPPRQRAVLILRDVLCWHADEVADLLETTVAAVNSALQRARTTIREPVARPLDPGHRELLERYCVAFARYDVDAMVALLREDAVMSMPPFAWWLRGREDIRAVLAAGAGACAGARMTPAAVNGTIGYRQTRPTGPGGAHEPFALLVFETAGGLITEVTTYLDAGRYTGDLSPARWSGAPVGAGPASCCWRARTASWKRA
jgi:RNA polymerase sigma-70 factor, ECF subfamily